MHVRVCICVCACAYMHVCLRACEPSTLTGSAHSTHRAHSSHCMQSNIHGFFGGRKVETCLRSSDRLATRRKEKENFQKRIKFLSWDCMDCVHRVHRVHRVQRVQRVQRVHVCTVCVQRVHCVPTSPISQQKKAVDFSERLCCEAGQRLRCA